MYSYITYRHTLLKVLYTWLSGIYQAKSGFLWLSLPDLSDQPLSVV